MATASPWARRLDRTRTPRELRDRPDSTGNTGSGPRSAPTSIVSGGEGAGAGTAGSESAAIGLELRGTSGGASSSPRLVSRSGRSELPDGRFSPIAARYSGCTSIGSQRFAALWKTSASGLSTPDRSARASSSTVL